MENYAPSGLVGLVGVIGVFVIGFASIVFQVIIFGRSGTAIDAMKVTVFTGLAAIVLVGFYVGKQGAPDQLWVLPDLDVVIGICISTVVLLVIQLFTSRPEQPTPEPKPVQNLPPTPKQPEPSDGQDMSGWMASLITIGLVVAGFVWLKSAYQSGSEAGRQELSESWRKEMYDGDLGPVLQLIAQRSPADLDAIISRLIAAKPGSQSEEDAFDFLEQEERRYERELFAYLPKLSDEQLKSILVARIDMLKALLGSPEICGRYAAGGFGALSPEEVDRFLELLSLEKARVMEALLNAKDAPTGQVDLRLPVSDDDYARIYDDLLASGMSEHQFEIVRTNTFTDPSYCETTIALMGAVLNQDGPSGGSIRYEWVQESFKVD